MQIPINLLQSRRILHGKIFNEPLWVLSGLFLASCGGGGGSATLSGVRSSTESKDIVVYEGQNRIPTFTITQTLPDEVINNVRIKISPLKLIIPELEVDTVQDKQIGKTTVNLPEFDTVLRNIKIIVTDIDTGESETVIISKWNIKYFASTGEIVDNNLIWADGGGIFYATTEILSDGKSVKIEQETYSASDETEIIKFKKITFTEGNFDAGGEVVITADDGNADEIGDELTANVDNVVDKNDLHPEFEYQWYKNGQQLAAETAKTYTPNMAGKYYVEVNVIDDQHPDPSNSATLLTSTMVDIA